MTAQQQISSRRGAGGQWSSPQARSLRTRAWRTDIVGVPHGTPAAASRWPEASLPPPREADPDPPSGPASGGRFAWLAAYRGETSGSSAAKSVRTEDRGRGTRRSWPCLRIGSLACATLEGWLPGRIGVGYGSAAPVADRRSAFVADDLDTRPLRVFPPALSPYTARRARAAAQ